MWSCVSELWLIALFRCVLHNRPLFNEERCRELVNTRRWAVLDVFLGQFLRSVGERPENHPLLMLPARRERAVLMRRHHTAPSRPRKGQEIDGGDSADAYFENFIRPMRSATGPFVPHSDYVRRVVDELEEDLSGDPR